MNPKQFGAWGSCAVAPQLGFSRGGRGVGGMGSRLGLPSGYVIGPRPSAVATELWYALRIHWFRRHTRSGHGTSLVLPWFEADNHCGFGGL